MFRRNFVQVFKYLTPLLILTGTVFLTYYCISHVFFGLVKHKYYITITLIWGVFSLSYVMWFWGFLTLFLSDPGSMENEMKANPGLKCNVKCIKCGSYKPVRCHHCSRCGKCMARMDHHCDALGTCIALRNLKPFIVFLFYSVVLTFIYGSSSLLLIAINGFNRSSKFLLFDLFSGGSLCVLLAILLVTNVQILLSGRTTIEDMYSIDLKMPGLTKYDHFVSIFGPPSIDWLKPEVTSYQQITAFDWEKYRERDNNTVIKYDDDINQHEEEAEEKPHIKDQ